MKRLSVAVMLVPILTISFSLFGEHSVSASETPSIEYSSHVQSDGWQDWETEGAVSGTTGESKRLEAIKVRLRNAPYSGDVEYRTYIEGSGWQNWVKNGAISGTVGEGKKVEAIQVRLTGEMAKKYDVHYRVFKQSDAWHRYVTNGDISGEPYNGKRVEAIRMAIVEKPVPLKDTDVATIVNDKTEINGKYTFIPRFIKGKTTVEPFGTGWSLKSISDRTFDKYWSFVPTSDSQKGKQGVIYKNVGVYNGQQVDLKVTVTDWDSYTKDKGNIAYSENHLGHTMQGYLSVSQTWEFINHETNQPIKVTGYMTINDIDTLQGISFGEEQMSKFDDIYAIDDDWIKYSFYDGMHHFYESNYRNLDTDDKRGMFTVTFTDQSSIDFDWGRLYEISDVNPDGVFNKETLDLGQYFSFTGKKLARTEIASPEKFIRDSNSNRLVKNSKLNSYKDTLKYEIHHTVNDELSEFYYDSWEIRDTIPKGLTVKSAKIYDQEGKDVSSYFNNDSKGNEIKFSAKSSILSSAKFYDKIYKLEIETVPKSLAGLRDIFPNKGIKWNNQASVTVEGDKKNTNSVVTDLNRIPIADFTATPRETNSKETVKFHNLSRDDDGDSLSYKWEYRKKGNTSWSRFDTKKHSELKFPPSNGTYEVRLTVTDTHGATDSHIEEVVIKNPPPEAVLTVTPNPTNRNTAVTIDGGGSTDPHGTKLKYSISYKKKDGNDSGTIVNNSPKPKHDYTFKYVGEYKVTLTVTNEYGLTDKATVTVNNQNISPYSGFTVSDQNVPADQVKKDKLDGYEVHQPIYIKSIAGDKDGRHDKKDLSVTYKLEVDYGSEDQSTVTYDVDAKNFVIDIDFLRGLAGNTDDVKQVKVIQRVQDFPRTGTSSFTSGDIRQTVKTIDVENVSIKGKVDHTDQMKEIRELLGVRDNSFYFNGEYFVLKAETLAIHEFQDVKVRMIIGNPSSPFSDKKEWYSLQFDGQNTSNGSTIDSWSYEETSNEFWRYQDGMRRKPNDIYFEFLGTSKYGVERINIVPVTIGDDIQTIYDINKAYGNNK